MTPHDFPEYAALWREQVDPKELAELQSMATKIKRSAGRRWLLDRVLALFAVGMTCLAILRYPAPPLIKLSLVLLLLVPIWYMWRRHQITRTSRAIAIDDPQLFFQAAIENMRAEIRLSTISAWLGIPVFIIAVSLAAAARGFDNLYINLRNNFMLGSAKIILATAIMVVALVFLIRDNIRLREQLRRLEAMRREWDERDPGEEP
jgi:uncharacterized membrane protein YidH (DUF202 family)